MWDCVKGGKREEEKKKAGAEMQLNSTVEPSVSTCLMWWAVIGNSVGRGSILGQGLLTQQ